MADSDGAHPTPRVRLDYAKPCDALAPFVFGYHLYAVDVPDGDFHEDIAYPSWTNIRFQTRGAPFSVRIGNRRIDPVPRAGLFGPTSRAIFPRSGAGTVVGLGLTPLGWTRMFGGDADLYADRVTPLGAMLGEEADALAAALEGIDAIGPAATIFDRFLLRHLGRPHRSEALVAAMQTELTAPEDFSVAGLARRLDLEPRRVARLSRAHFGFTPKLLLRRTRFMRTLLRLMEDDGRPYVGKIDRGYHDQSHFVRDCRFFLSMSPRRFIQMPRPMNVESMVKRLFVLGATVQALHQPGLAPDDA